MRPPGDCLMKDSLTLSFMEGPFPTPTLQVLLVGGRPK